VGTYYYLVLAAADAIPNAATVKAQGSAVAKGTAAATASANTVNLTALSAGTAYKAHVIVEDAATNASAVSSYAFTTVAADFTTGTVAAVDTGSQHAIGDVVTVTLSDSTFEAGTLYLHKSSTTYTVDATTASDLSSVVLLAASDTARFVLTGATTPTNSATDTLTVVGTVITTTPSAAVADFYHAVNATVLDVAAAGGTIELNDVTTLSAMKTQLEALTITANSAEFTATIDASSTDLSDITDTTNVKTGDAVLVFDIEAATGYALVDLDSSTDSLSTLTDAIKAKIVNSTPDAGDFKADSVGVVLDADDATLTVTITLVAGA
jgi:hypothetical protein